MRIIISSAGRRVYLVSWFQQALEKANLSGEVYVLDHDPHAAAAAAADEYRWVPAFSSPEYTDHLLAIVDELQPDLFISLNDYELTVLSQGLADQLRARGIVVPVLDADSHRAVADKLTMSHVLQQAGISTPETVLLSDRVAVEEVLKTSAGVIVKDRWGSGSSGLRRFTAEEARDWLADQYARRKDPTAVNLEDLIVQPDLGGIEHGLDIVTAVRGGPVEGVLARRKLGMRHGETSHAITVDNVRFIGLAAALNATLGIQGTVDVDVMVTEDGVTHVIDINPRFGGGYPFSHIAGADVPYFFVTSCLGLSPSADWAQYTRGYLGAKHEGIIGFQSTVEEQHASAQETEQHIVLRHAG